LKKQKSNRGSLFIISAPSGAGKTTLCKKIAETVDNLRQSVSFTTRQPREGEVNNVDYTFIGKKEFMKMVEAGDFIEWAEVHGNLYGTSGSRLHELMDSGYDVLLDIDTQGAKQIRNSRNKGVFVFILPPSMTVLRERLEKRKSNTKDDMERRLCRAKDEIRDYKMYDYVIVNDVLRSSVKRLEAVITAERLRNENIDPCWIEKNFLL
jgi:guanylate kinase